MGYPDYTEAWETEIEAELDDLLQGFGQPIDVYKRAAGSPNQFSQEKKEWTPASPVSCQGRCIFKPTTEELTVQGSLQDIDVAILFARLEMVRKFPAGTVYEWILEDDEIAFDGYRFRVHKAHATGRVSAFTTLYVVLGKNILGGLRDP